MTTQVSKVFCWSNSEGSSHFQVSKPKETLSARLNKLKKWSPVMKRTVFAFTSTFVWFRLKTVYSSNHDYIQLLNQLGGWSLWSKSTLYAKLVSNRFSLHWVQPIPHEQHGSSPSSRINWSKRTKLPVIGKLAKNPSRLKGSVLNSIWTLEHSLCLFHSMQKRSVSS